MFITELDTRAYEPGEWILLAPLIWFDGHVKIVVPRRFITDLASIPKVFRITLDRNGPSRKAAVLHDWLYCTQPMDRAAADLLFLQALASEREGWLKRQAMYRGVQAGGWKRWGQRHGLTADDIYQGPLPHLTEDA